MCFNCVDYLNFSAREYQIYEDEGSLCINLTLHKPAFFDTTIEVDELTGTAIGKLCNSCVL